MADFGRWGEEMPHLVPVTPLVPRHPVGLTLQLERAGLDLELEYPGLSDWLPGTLGSCSSGSAGRRIPFLPLAAPSLASSCLKSSYRSLGSGDHLWERASSGLEIAKCTEITLASKRTWKIKQEHQHLCPFPQPSSQDSALLPHFAD